MLIASLTLCSVRAQDSRFTYQGVLREAGATVQGGHHFEFRLFDAETNGVQVAGPVESGVVDVKDGLFTVMVDLGSGVWGPDPRWLEISVRTNDPAAPWIILVPRQSLSSVPLAMRSGSSGFAESAASADSVAPGAVTGEGIVPGSLLATHIAPDQIVRSVNGLRDDVMIQGGTNTVVTSDASGLTIHQSGWGLRGNAGTVAGVDYLGTSDDQPLDLGVNGRRALRLKSFAGGSGVNVLAGYEGNFVAAGLQGVTISGGGAYYSADLNYTHQVSSDFTTLGGGMAHVIEASASYSTIAGGFANRIAEWSDRAFVGGGAYNAIGNEAGFSTISGGYTNQIGSKSHTSVIGGGGENVIGLQSHFATIAGGTGNLIGDSSFTSTIGGGGLNRIGSDARRSTIGGGRGNVIDDSSPHSTIGGGDTNVIGLAAEGATIPGGSSNRVDGAHGFAAGTQAEARHPGAFVWSDASGMPFPSEATNEVAFRATGGMRVVTAVDSGGNATAGVTLSAGSGSWAMLSDRNAKTGFEPVDARAILQRLAALPVQRWRYRSESPPAEHLGPTAQDFHDAFGLGANDRNIAMVDADGVALAAVQGLYEVVREQQATIERLEKTIDQLAAGTSNAPRVGR